MPGGVIGLGWNAFSKEVKVTTTLGSQKNMVVERCNLNELPTVCWDGRTDIPPVITPSSPREPPFARAKM